MHSHVAIRGAYAVIMVCILTGICRAGVASDILSITDNARTRLIWVRYPWCDSAFNPVQQYRSKDGGNEGPYTQLMVFDTDEGVERYLDPQIGYHRVPRLTRKNGDHVIWSDSAGACAWIRDFSGASPRRKLLEGGDYTVVHCRHDPATDKEYIYTLSADGLRLSMISLRADYTADLASRTVVYTAAAKMKTVLGVSADGRYLGTLSPWPNTMIVDMTTGQKYNRHLSEAFGCQPNMAPDNSYRFFYLSSDHRVLRMWGPGLSTEQWDIQADRMPGNFEFISGHYHDCIAPRWTNNARFFTNGYPLVMWHFSDGGLFSNSAGSLREYQAKDSCGTGVFCLGKLTQDYKSVETYVRVTTCDVRKRDAVGDAWIGGSTASAISPRGRKASGPRRSAAIVVGGGIAQIRMPGRGTVEIFDARGGSVMRTEGDASLRLSTAALPGGVYRARITCNGQTFHSGLVIGRLDL